MIAYEGIAALGGEYLFQPDHQPMIANQGHILTTPEQIDALTVPDPWRNARFLHLRAWQEELNRRFPGETVCGLAGQEGPITSAGLLRGQQFFFDCLDDPARAHKLLDVVTEMYIIWNRASDQACGVGERKTVGIVDDYAGLLSPAMWGEFVLPYYRRIISALGPQGCYLHTELLRREHLPLLRDLHLLHLDLGDDQYLSPQDAMELLPGMDFDWHIYTIPEMQQGTPEGIRRRMFELVELGVRDIRTDLSVNTPPANIRTFVETAQELERAPS